MSTEKQLPVGFFVPKFDFVCIFWIHLGSKAIRKLMGVQIFPEDTKISLLRVI